MKKLFGVLFRRYKSADDETNEGPGTQIPLCPLPQAFRPTPATQIQLSNWAEGPGFWVSIVAKGSILQGGGKGGKW